MQHPEYISNNPEVRSSPVRRLYADPPEPEFVGDGDSGGWLEYLQVLRRRKGTILVVTLLGALAGWLYTLPQTPMYQAHASLEIQRLNENFLNIRDLSATDTTSSTNPDADIQTQVKILESPLLVERVATKMKLQKRQDVVYKPDRLSIWREALGLSGRTPVSAQELALASAAASLNVRSSRQNRIVEVLCDSTDPQLAADFINMLTNEYIEQNLELRWNPTQQTGESLTRALEDLKTKLEQSEEKLQDYARSSGLMFTPQKDSEEKLRQLQGELTKAQAERVSRQSQFGITSSSSSASLPEVLDNGPLREYQVKLTELRRELAELSSTLTPAHNKVKRVQAQITELESTVERERNNIVNRVHNEYESASRREKLLAAACAEQSRVVSELSAKAIQYDMFKREVDSNRQLYEAMLQKVKEARVASTMRASPVRVVNPARPSSSPYKPKPFLSVSLGLMGGAFFGLMLVFIHERTDSTIQAPGDAPGYLNVPELGVIPSAKLDLNQRLSGKRRRLFFFKMMPKAKSLIGKAATKPGNGGLMGERLELVTWQRKPSLLAESFRATLTSILFSRQNGNRPRVIVLSSPNPVEGKSTILSNLGIALAEINRRVLLIDGDMRKPSLHEIFNLANSWGLSDLLREKNPIEECPLEALTKRTEIPGLYLLPSGPGTVSISNLLYSARLPELLRRFRQEFDTVLIDTPPMLQLSDARVLACLADGVILIFRAGGTTRDAAVAATQRLALDGIPILGTILNDWNPKKNAGSGHYGNFSFHTVGEGKDA